jgi:sec-independent protein translocase protein TatB
MILTILKSIPIAPHEGISAASIGIPDTFFLMLLALIVFGPRRLPEIGRQIGKLMYEFRKVSNDFKFQMEEELRASEEAERIRKLEAQQAAAPAQQALTESASSQPAIDVARLDVPPHPALQSPEVPPNTDGTVSAGFDFAADYAPAVEGEVRAESPSIQPPSSGETIAAQKPFRHRVAEVAPEPVSDRVTESGGPAIHEAAEPLILNDEGRTGKEVQPGVERNIGPSPVANSAPAEEQELHHG